MTGNVIGQTIVAYHGCDIEVGSKVIEGEILHLTPSKNPYDWLGDGIYFFEDDLLRAQYFGDWPAFACANCGSKYILHFGVFSPAAANARSIPRAEQIGPSSLP